MQRWLQTMLSAPERRFPGCPAALSFVPLLSPEEAMEALEARAQALTARLAEVDPAADGVPRLFLVVEEYEEALTRAELEWVRSLVADLRSGQLSWSEEWLQSLMEPTP